MSFLVSERKAISYDRCEGGGIWLGDEYMKSIFEEQGKEKYYDVTFTADTVKKGLM